MDLNKNTDFLNISSWFWSFKYRFSHKLRPLKKRGISPWEGQMQDYID